MAKDPAFLFYSADFLMGAMVLTMEQRGQYITILSLLHQHGRLTEEEIKNAMNCEIIPNVLKKLKKDSENKIYSERLETEMKKRSDFTESRRNSLKIDNGDMVHLYLVKASKGEELYKIGSSKYPMLRLKEVVKYKPDAFFFWISDGLYERVNEKFLHEEFSSKRHKYDWFFLDDCDLTSIKNKYSQTPHTDNEDENSNSHSVFSLRLLSNKGELDKQAIEVSTKVEVTKELLSQFNANLKNSNVHHRHFSEYKKHLVNWIPKKPKEQNHNHGNNTRKGHNIEGVSNAADKILRDYQDKLNNGGDQQSDTDIGANEKRA